MTSAVSALNNIHKLGIFGNHESKNEKNLLNLSEVKNMLIVQIIKNVGNDKDKIQLELMKRSKMFREKIEEIRKDEENNRVNNRFRVPT